MGKAALIIKPRKKCNDIFVIHIIHPVDLIIQEIPENNVINDDHSKYY